MKQKLFIVIFSILFGFNFSGCATDNRIGGNVSIFGAKDSTTYAQNGYSLRILERTPEAHGLLQLQIVSIPPESEIIAYWTADGKKKSSDFIEISNFNQFVKDIKVNVKDIFQIANSIGKEHFALFIEDDQGNMIYFINVGLENLMVSTPATNRSVMIDHPMEVYIK